MEWLLDVVKEFKFIRSDKIILLMGNLITQNNKTLSQCDYVGTHDHFFLFPHRSTIYSSSSYILSPLFSVSQCRRNHNQRSTIAIKPEKHYKSNCIRWQYLKLKCNNMLLNMWLLIWFSPWVNDSYVSHKWIRAIRFLLLRQLLVYIKAQGNRSSPQHAVCQYFQWPTQIGTLLWGTLKFSSYLCHWALQFTQLYICFDMLWQVICKMFPLVMFLLFSFPNVER